MSISSAWSPNLVQVNPKAPFNSVPKVLLGPIFSYLIGDEKDDWNANVEPNSILAIDRVCKQWQSHPGLQALKNGRENRISQYYPPTLREPFARNGMKISQLPIWDFGGRRYVYIGERVLIASTEEEHSPMQHGVMRFKDVSGRPGLALKVRVDGEVREYALRKFLKQKGGIVKIIQNSIADSFRACGRNGILNSLASLNARVHWLATVMITCYLIGMKAVDTELVFFKPSPEDRVNPDRANWQRIGNLFERDGMFIDYLEDTSDYEPSHFDSRLIHPDLLSDLLQGKVSLFTLPGFNGMPSGEPSVNRKALQRQMLVTTALAALLICLILDVAAEHF